MNTLNLLHQLGLKNDSFFGKVVLITGAARGIGASAAEAFAQLGARVVLADISLKGEALAKQLQGAGHEALFLQVDLRVDDELAQMLDEVNSRLGPIDIVINNAAYLKPGLLLELPIEAWDDSYRLHVRAAVMIAKAVLPTMLARNQGVICAVMSLEGMATMSHYCAAKMGLRSMILSLAKEIPPESNVSAFCTIPGSVDTPLVHEIVDAISRRLGVPADDVMTSIANNPGYPGLVPAEHAAASLAWFCLHARHYSGQYVDGYLPLSQAGVIQIENHTSTDQMASIKRFPNPGEELFEMIRINRELEERVAQRTRELRELTDQLEIANKALEHASLTDSLTGLGNRRFVESTFKDEILQYGRHSTHRSAIVLVDIDHFKWINDQYGHQAGDSVIQNLASILRQNLRPQDRIARWGGEEFLIVLRDIADSEISLVIERLRRTVASHSFAISEGVSVACTCSFGISPYPVSDPNPIKPWQYYLSIADRSLYAAKASGRNTWIRIEVQEEVADFTDTDPVIWDLETMCSRGQLKVETGLSSISQIRWK